MNPTPLILAGIGNSGAEHWQTLWQAEDPRFDKLEHSEWDAPDRVVWEAELEAKVAELGENVVLVAHSLACLLVAYWAASTRQRVAGALLVSVPDPAGPSFPSSAVNFGGVPLTPLPFPSIVVVSTNDPYASAEFMKACAEAWGSDCRRVGALGHINAGSNVGNWPQGRAFLGELEG